MAGLALALAAAGCASDEEVPVEEGLTEQTASEEASSEMLNEEDTSAVASPEETISMDDGDSAGATGAPYSTVLGSLNSSGAASTASFEVDGDQVTVTIEATDLAAGLPHAQHLHIGGENTCPTNDVAGEDGVVSTPEGQPAYGEIAIALTTEGDVSPASALAVERFPTAGDDGRLDYSRTFDLPEGVTAEDLATGVVVQHGLADSPLGSDPSTYDGPDSPLAEGVPQEATLPVLCGALEPVQS